MYPRLSYLKPSLNPPTFSYPYFFLCMFVCITQNNNETAVWMASNAYHFEVVKALVAAGADLSIASVSTLLVTLAEVAWLLPYPYVVLPPPTPSPLPLLHLFHIMYLYVILPNLLEHPYETPFIGFRIFLSRVPLWCFFSFSLLFLCML